MNSSFTVSLILQAVNNASSTLGQVSRQVQDLGNVAGRVASQIGGCNPFARWQGYAKQAYQWLENLHNDSQRLMGSGYQDMAFGREFINPFYHLVEQAGDIQMKKIQLGSVYGLSETSQQLKDIEMQAERLSNTTLFDKAQVLGINVELAHAGINREALQKVVPEATYLAEVEVLIGKSGSARETAYNFARMAEDAGITSSIERMARFADEMNRVINVTHASSHSLGETFKYAMPVVKNLGWTELDTLYASAMAARAGIEGSMAGTHIKDFAQRINPYIYLKDENIAGGAGGQKQLWAMQEAGLIHGIQTITTRQGKEKIVGFERADLLKDKDHLVGYSEMVRILAQKREEFLKRGGSSQALKDLTQEELEKIQQNYKLATGRDLSGGELQWAALMHKIFGEQGQDFAIITSHQEMYERLEKQLEMQKSLHEQIKIIRNSYEGQKHALLTAIKNTGLTVGTYLLPEVTAFLRQATPYVEKLQEWIRGHQQVVTSIGLAVMKVGLFVAALGVGKLVLGGLGYFVLGPIKSIIGLGVAMLGAASRVHTAARGLSQAYSYFRQGSSVLHALWSAVAFGNARLTALGRIATMAGRLGMGAFKVLDIAGTTVLGRLSIIIQRTAQGALMAARLAGQFGMTLMRLGMQALAAAARMAAAWLIGLGPIGWIILGVSAVIAAAITAWKTNFLGFRDWLTDVWQKVKTVSLKVWENIKSAGTQIWDTIVNKVDWAVAAFQKAHAWLEKVFSILDRTPSGSTGMGGLRAADLPAYASGGLITAPHIGMIGEKGPEAIIPLSYSMRSQALELYLTVGRLLGVKQHAGGAIYLRGRIAAAGASGNNVAIAINSPTAPGPNIVPRVRSGDISIALSCDNITIQQTGHGEKSARESARQFVRQIMPEIVRELKRQLRLEKHRAPWEE